MCDGTKEKALILIDEANFYYGFKKKSWTIDYKKFLSFFRSIYDVSEAYFFSGIISKKAFFDSHLELNPTQDLVRFLDVSRRQRDRHKNIKKMGYRVVEKPVASIYDNTCNKHKRKCNFDVEITIKAINLVDKYETMVLCSGDGDFVKLVKYIKGKHKKTVVP